MKILLMSTDEGIPASLGANRMKLIVSTFTAHGSAFMTTVNISYKYAKDKIKRIK